MSPVTWLWNQFITATSGHCFAALLLLRFAPLGWLWLRLLLLILLLDDLLLENPLEEQGTGLPIQLTAPAEIRGAGGKTVGQVIPATLCGGYAQLIEQPRGQLGNYGLQHNAAEPQSVHCHGDYGLQTGRVGIRCARLQRPGFGALEEVVGRMQSRHRSVGHQVEVIALVMRRASLCKIRNIQGT